MEKQTVEKAIADAKVERVKIKQDIIDLQQKLEIRHAEARSLESFIDVLNSLKEC